MNLFQGAGLDGRSVLVGAVLVLAGMVAAEGRGLVPLLIMGGIVYMIGGKKGWWGNRNPGERRGPLAHPPAVFEEWHRQTHAGGSHAAGGYAPHPQTAAWQPPVPPTPPTPSAPPASTPQEAEVHIPVNHAPGYSRTVGEADENVA